MRALVLASTSPRRRELLREAGLRFQVLSPDVDESALAAEPPEDTARRLALAKASAVLPQVARETCILGADTIVVIDGAQLGKPRDADEAVEMLLRLAGRTHRVLTGFALLVPALGVRESGVVESFVRMHPIERVTAEKYAASGEPLDKAGAYAAQGEGARFIAEIRGSRANVIGLPVEELGPRLARLGVTKHE
ncbi:MAG TPA: Maf family protein [Myxococcota bacterium]|nr:Maf family protein [Myxococcota bacterium]